MRKATINKSFTVIQWHGKDYPYYGEDAELGAFNKGDEVLVLHEATPNPMGRLYVVYSERINQAVVVTGAYLDFIDNN